MVVNNNFQFLASMDYVTHVTPENYLSSDLIGPANYSKQDVHFICLPANLLFQ